MHDACTILLLWGDPKGPVASLWTWYYHSLCLISSLFLTAAPVYTHFTSPIRRYADLVVHRLLSAAIGDTSLPTINADRAKQQELCSHMNRFPFASHSG